MTPSLMSDEGWVEVHYSKEQVETYIEEAVTQLGNEWARRLGGVLEAVHRDLEFYKGYTAPSVNSLEDAIHVARAWAKHSETCDNPDCPVRVAARAWGIDKEDKEEDEEV